VELELITQIPDKNPRPTPVLFVHGAWHGAWCWENFLPYFASRGYGSYAVSLRGHGKSAGRKGIRWYSASHDYVADVAQIARTFGTPPVVVGHSMGGYIVQKYLEQQTAAAGVLLASIPVSGIFRFGMRNLRRHPWPSIKAHLLLSLWQLVSTPELAHDAFFSPGVASEEVARHFARLQQESFRFELEAMLLDLPHPNKVKAPMLVLAAANDRVFSVAEAQATARAYNTEAEVFPDMAHDMMLEPGWQKVAERIVAWLQERDL
jgi:pimeloyl-ACP methyl ester carboxylesterase